MQTAIILEDHEDTRDWLASVLQSTFAEMDIKTASTIAQARRHCEQQHFDLALIDLNLPDGTGVDFIKLLRATSPETFCLVVTVFDDDKHLFPALTAGANGYLLKGLSSEEFTQSLQGILTGEPPISPAIAKKMIGHFHQSPKEDRVTDLSTREVEILTMIASGLNRTQAAKSLHISPHTVATHIKTIYSKLNISSRAEATLEALRLGLLKT